MTSEIVAGEFERVRALMRDPCAVFVFGSNLEGVHGAGAAREAVKRYGAVRAVGFGPAGRTYAIPTKAHWRDRAGLELGRIRGYVARFIAHASAHPHSMFVVTRIGCGYAGYTDADIAPLFAQAPANCMLPEGWRS